MENFKGKIYSECSFKKRKNIYENMDLKEVCKKLKFTYSLHNAVHGSKYYRINSIKFRVSDHNQPSHYQMKQYFNVDSEKQIIDIITNKLFNFYANPTKKDDGYIDAIYNESNDTFKIKKITKNEYNKLVLKMKKRNAFYIENGYLGDLM